MAMINRENRTWKPFMFAMPAMTAAQRQERAILFGLYAGAYLNGMEYLQAWQAAELAMIAADYNQKMAALDAEEQKAVMEIAARRYLARVDQVVHDARMNGMRQQAADDSAMMDARFEALQADCKALETLAVRLDQQEKITAARVAVLQAQIAGEELNRQMVDIDIARAGLDAARKETQLAEKDIALSEKELEISRADLAISGKETQVLEQQVRIEEKDLQKARAELEQARKDLEITHAGQEVLRTQMQIIEASIKEIEHERDMARLEIEKIGTEEKTIRLDYTALEEKEAELAKKRAGLRIKETELKAVQADADKETMQARIHGLEVDRVKTDREIASIEIEIQRTEERIARTALLEGELEMAETRYRVIEKGLELYQHRLQEALLEKETATADMTHAEAARVIEEAIGDLKRQAQTGRHALQLSRMDIHLTAELLRLTYRRLKLQTDMEMSGSEDRYQPLMDAWHEYVNQRRRTAAENKKKAAIEAAEKVAAADILTTMTHSIGKV